jgi:hypothetical protein
MLRVLHLTLVVCGVLLSFLVRIDLGNARITDAKSQLVAQSTDNSPVCYMQTPDGNTVDLRALCGQGSTPSVTPRPSAVESEATKMAITEVRYEGNSLSGRVTNQTGNTVQGVKVNYEVRDRKGNAIDNGFIYAQPSTIPPGGSASFSGKTEQGAKVEPTFVEWGN